jgi:isoquinoline 1-oxidoreductase alpha subunit
MREATRAQAVALPSHARREERAISAGGLRMTTAFTVNGKAVQSAAPAHTPLLWVIREELKLTGTKFGCGTGLCGACTVHVDGRRAFSCQTQVSEVGGRAVTTIEGLSETSSHPVQKATASRARS